MAATQRNTKNTKELAASVKMVSGLINGELVQVPKGVHKVVEALKENTDKLDKATPAVKRLGDAARNAADGLKNVSSGLGDMASGLDGVRDRIFKSQFPDKSGGVFAYRGPAGYPTDLQDPYQVGLWNEFLKELSKRSRLIYTGWELPMPGPSTTIVNINTGWVLDPDGVREVSAMIGEELERTAKLKY